MAKKKQKDSLTDLLDGVEKAHKAQIQLYTSGHLNHDKLFRPQVLVKHSYWESAKNPGLIPRRRAQFTAPSEASRKSKNTSTSYAGTPTPTRAKSASHSCRQPWASKASSRAPVSISLGAAAFKPQQKDTPEETEGGVGLFQKKLIQEELEVPELKILKYKPTRNSQLCVMQGIKDEYQFLPSYLAGVTKTDQFHKFMQFQKDFIAKRDLLENDFIGSKSAEQHERKLAQVERTVVTITATTMSHAGNGFLDKLLKRRKEGVWETCASACGSSLLPSLPSSNAPFSAFGSPVVTSHAGCKGHVVMAQPVEYQLQEHHSSQALRNICDCNRPHFYRLQAVGDVFEDICNSSLIFGDILREVKLTEIVSDLVLRTPRMLVLGDFNLHAESGLTGAAQDFMASMTAMGLSQHVTGPTHEHGHTLDLVFSMGQEEGGLRVRNLCLKPLSWSDHFLVSRGVRFKELDLIDRVPEELRMEVRNIVQEAATKTIPKKKKWKKAKWLSEEALQITEEGREVKGKGERERYTQLNAEFQRIARRDKNAFLNEQCKEIEENNRIGRTRDLFKKIGDMKGTFHAKMGMIKDQNGKDLTEADEIKKRWQDYTEELYKKELNVPDNHDGVVTDLEPDILECEVKWALGILSNNKASGGDSIPADLFKILKDDAVKVLHSICQQIWKTQQWLQDWKRTVYIPIPKKGNAKECSNYCTIALISHASTVMLQILQTRLQQYVDQELPEVQAGFRRERGTRNQIANIRWIMEKAREFQKNIYFCFIDYAKVFDCVDHNTLWQVLKEMGVPDHLICLLRNLYVGQEATVRTGHRTTDWFKIEKGVRQGYILSPCLFHLYAEHIMRKAGLDESPVGIKIAGRNINNLRYADDITLMAESEEELKSLLMRVKEESAKVGLKLNIKKTMIVASGPLTAWKIDGEEMEVVTDFIFLGSKITADGDCSQEIKRRLLLGRKAMANLHSILKSRDITLPTKVRIVKAMNEYELYVVILLDSLPTTQYRSLQNEVKGMEKRTVMTHEIEEKRHDIQALVQKSKLALARNEDGEPAVHQILQAGSPTYLNSSATWEVGRRLQRRWRRSRDESDRTHLRAHYRAYAVAVRAAKKRFFSASIASSKCRPAELFRVVQGLVRPGPKKHLVPPSKARCDNFAMHFREKIAQIRHELDTTSESEVSGETPMLLSGPKLLDEFQLLWPDDVDKGRVRPTTCLLDPCPSWLINNSKHEIGIWILEVVNASLREGRVPAPLKEAVVRAVVRPVLKKASLDPEMATNYRLVANILFLGKVLERVVVGQLQALLDETDYLDPVQSGFRPGYGTESALVTLYDDLCREKDRGSASLLVLLDLSAAFDTIDHGILLDRLAGLGVGGTALQWFRSYLDGRFQKVVLGDYGSAPWQLCQQPGSSILNQLKYLDRLQGQPHVERVTEVKPLDIKATSIISHPGDHHSFVLAEKERAGKSETPPLSSVEQLTSLRSQIIMKWEEIRAMEREIKDTMTFAAIANIREKTVKELEGEASKLQASNNFLKKQIRDVEHNITSALMRQKLNGECQRCLWELVKDFLTYQGKEDPYEQLEESSSSASCSNL
ncbi:hypothetical protein EYD10_00388 [Varanus komodoensis]|nr:hypothetical protein EYD10_00388 [Varanus komodoensis]